MGFAVICSKIADGVLCAGDRHGKVNICREFYYLLSEQENETLVPGGYVLPCMHVAISRKIVLKHISFKAWEFAENIRRTIFGYSRSMVDVYGKPEIRSC